MTTIEGAPAEVAIVAVEPHPIALVRHTIPMSDMMWARREARALLEAALKEAGVETSGRTLTLWRPPHAGTIEYAPGVLLPHAIDASGAVSVSTLPEGRAAHLRMEGSYAGLPEAWQRLFGECQARGLGLAGINWEIYGAPEDGGADLYSLLAPDHPTPA